MPQNNHVLEYIRLFRLQTGAITAVAPVAGYVILTAIEPEIELKLATTAILFIIGVLMHIFIFVLNEYIDIDIDRLSPDLSEKPLVKQSVSMQGALIVILTSVSLTYLLTILFFPAFWVLVILTISHVCGVVYDVYGKKFPGSDFVLAGWIFWFCIFGACAADLSINPFELPLILYIISGLGFMQIVFNNAVEGGLKDVDHDHIGDARTLATVMGVKVKKGLLSVSPSFKMFTWSIKIIHIILFLSLFFNPDLDFWQYEPFISQVTILLLISALIAVIFFTTYRFLNFKTFDRSKLKRIFSIHEISTYFIVPLILVPILGLPISIGLLVLPLIWFICLNLILYGKPLEPRV
jgi:4-hydroxybenzoate polyprenyltransferase